MLFDYFLYTTTYFTDKISWFKLEQLITEIIHFFSVFSYIDNDCFHSVAASFISYESKLFHENDKF